MDSENHQILLPYYLKRIKGFLKEANPLKLVFRLDKGKYSYNFSEYERKDLISKFDMDIDKSDIQSGFVTLTLYPYEPQQVVKPYYVAFEPEPEIKSEVVKELETEFTYDGRGPIPPPNWRRYAPGRNYANMQ